LAFWAATICSAVNMVESPEVSGLKAGLPLAARIVCCSATWNQV
jgi:hypothetical protein